MALDIDDTLSRQHGIRKRAYEAGICDARHVSLVRADARARPFANDSFDAVTAISSLEHAEGQAGDRLALREASRVLRDQGQVS